MANPVPECQICGSAVRIEMVLGTRTITDVVEPYVERRICTNYECRSNTGIDSRMTDVV